MSSTYYITTTLPYVNAAPHIGFGLEIVAADVLARAHALNGEKILFNTGTDEHGQKVEASAQKLGQPTLDYATKQAETFQRLKSELNLSVTNFIRTTDPHHQAAAQEFWRRCEKAGDIYKATYTVLYCTGCELEKTDSELTDGVCPLHPNQNLEHRSEENYFFRFSRFQEPLLQLYQNEADFVEPTEKLREVMAFVKGGLKDFSISRLKTKMGWGVPVPGDDSQVMYVWFDALVNYISTLGWPSEESDFQAWPGVQVAGKDNLRQQAAMWQAMLMSAGLPNSSKILINGFISIDGQKMSKSLGNVISPSQMLQRYGLDATRYLLMRLGPFGGDSDASWERFDTLYQAELANGLGNLASRITKLCSSHQLPVVKDLSRHPSLDLLLVNKITEALNVLLDEINQLNQYLSNEKPWQQTGEIQLQTLRKARESLLDISVGLKPFMPQLAQQLIDHLSAAQIKPLLPLFPRLETERAE